jgi:ABC-type sugar transport system substrate-binding protein
VTLNASTAGILLLKQGWVQGDVGWSPSQEGAIATRLLSQAIAGQIPAQVKVPVPCYTPLTLITASNIPKATPWTPTPRLAKAWVYTPCENQTVSTAFAS